MHLAVLWRRWSLVRAGTLLARPLLPGDQGLELLTGITYTDAHAVLPTKAILAVAP